jgi:hypothetical protein
MLKVTPILYHGTTSKNAEALLKNGWKQNGAPVGANNGSPEYLYLSTDRVDARFYGYMNDEDDPEVLAVSNLPLAALAVDPEDSQTSTVEEELAHAANFPSRFVLTQPIPASHFSQLRDSANLAEAPPPVTPHEGFQ